MRGLLILTTLAAVAAASATAQTWRPYQPPYAPYPGGAAAAIADQHRYENDRLRNQAQANAFSFSTRSVFSQLKPPSASGARPKWP